MGFHSPLRKSHLQPSTTAAPPSSYSRQTGSTFRDSLRRIPSSIFTRGDTKKEMERKKSVDKLNMEPIPAKMAVRAPIVEAGMIKEKEKKVKTKTRKALGELFGWGNSASSAPTHPVISPPSPLRCALPTLPSKAPTPPIKDHTILRKAPPSAIPRKPSFGSIVSRPTVTALRAPSPLNYGRPSIGDDPFGRDDNGAEVVTHAPKRDTQTPSIKSDFSAERRRDSCHSGKALSTKTVASDEVSVHGVAMRARMSSPRRVTMASVIEEKKRMSNSPPRPNSHSAPTLNPLIAPPPRSDSLNRDLFPAPRQAAPHPRVRVTNAPMYASAPAPPPTPAPALVPAPPSASTKKPSMAGLKKEKTRSRVWGFLGKKSGKAKEDKENEQPELVETINSRPFVLGSNVQVLHHGISRPNISASHVSPPFRPAVPVFHVSHPSVDTSSATCADSPCPIRKDLQPEYGWNNTLIVDAPNKRDSGSTIASFSDFKAAIEEANNGGHGTSTTGAEHCAQLLAGPKALPKRKSLSGLFGLDIKGSSSDLQAPLVSARSFASDHSGFDWSPPKLRPLSEEMNEMTFGSFSGNDLGNPTLQKPDPSLRRVASATDKLVSLVSNFDFSPAPSPANPRIAPVASFTSLRHRISNSPTPIRKVKSAMLFHKSNTPPVKASAISPLKYVLHRAHVRKMDGVGICAEKPDTDSPPPSSLVKRGMRNPFAPPSPDRGSGGSTTPAVVAGSPLAKRARDPIAFGPAMGLAGFMDEQTSGDVGDVPADLQAMFMGLQGEDADLGALGLPVPPMDRVAPRRPARAAPKISLPPVPPPARPSTTSTPLSVNIKTVIDQDQDFAVDQYTTPIDNRKSFDFVNNSSGNRDSFDFTSEYEELDRGTHRASFVEALHRIGSSDMLKAKMADLPALPPLPAGPLWTIEQSPDSVRTLKMGDTHADRFADAPEPTVTRYVSPARPRKAPFQGTFAFQQQIIGKTSPNLPPPVPPLPAHLAPESIWTKSHSRGESGLSIATLSSVGSVIDTAETAREYTNYFEVNFTQHLAKQTSATQAHSRGTSIDSLYLDTSDPRAPTRRAHHRRNSSIISVESIGVPGQVLSTGLPPNSLYNNVRRSGYISKHRRDGSTDSAFGRSDWASHRRSMSTESTTSVTSVSRIVRPGLGDRMFKLDGGVQLSSITGSPADALTHNRGRSGSWASSDREEVSYDTILDGSPKDAIFDSLFDGRGVASGSETEAEAEAERHSLSSSSTEKRFSGLSESVFGADTEEAVIKQGFFLKGMRPVSAISSGLSSENGEDTFLDIKRYIKRAKEECFESPGEEHMTPIQETLRRSTGTSSLSGSFPRPAKPNSARRRRPAHLVFGMADPSTPGLTSPSTSETSSRLSLETRFSSERSMGHFRQKSSANIHTQATIKEEISLATLRPPKSSSSPRVRIVLSRENLRRQDTLAAYESDEDKDDDSTESITAWLRFQREADEVCRRTKSDFRDSAESRAAVAEFQGQTRFSPQSVADFLAQSAAVYKPLEKAIPTQRPRDQAHRRKVSLADARALTSPYGLPLPKPATVNKPRGSLTTKFERSNSAASYISSEDGAGAGGDGTPKSGIFDHLMSDLVPSPRRSPPRSAPPPSTGVFAGFLHQRQSPSGDVFNLASHAAGGQQKRGKASDPPARTQPLVSLSKENQAVGPADNRARVDSGTRRKALGWGRRRNSDGPAQVVQSKVVPLGVGLGPRMARAAVMKDKENAVVPPVPAIKMKSIPRPRYPSGARPAQRAAGPIGGRAMRA